MSDLLDCVVCGSHNTTSIPDQETFTYGDDRTGPTLEVTAEVVLHGCIDCGFQWTDETAERARAEAITNTLYGKYREYVAYQRNINEALNTGNGCYRP
jgi:Zn ribbon nucleic-acid-binding protein